MRILLIVVAVFVTALAVLAAPDDRFKGASCDGYADASVTNSKIPLPEGFVITIR